MDQFVLVPLSVWENRGFLDNSPTPVLQPKERTIEPQIESLIPIEHFPKSSQPIVAQINKEPRVKVSSFGNIVIDNSDTQIPLKTLLKFFNSKAKVQNPQFEDVGLALLDILKISPSTVLNPNLKKHERGSWISFNI